ncbi:MAG: hypothetical protein ACFCUN_00595 [Hyphomicrobiaceae bacterium]
MRILINLVAVVLEIALIVAVAYLGAVEPLWFAGLAVLVALSAAATLEYARFAHEMPFYFGRALSGVPAALARLWTTGEAGLKSLVAGFVALLTFSGTDQDRLAWTAVLFGLCVFIGTSALLRVSLTWGPRAARWGYFRLALPLGIVFSAGLYVYQLAGLIKPASLQALAFDATFNLARKPDLATASEFLFRLSQATDALIGQLLSFVVPENVVPYIQIVASTNVLPGFVIAVFAVAIARIVFWFLAAVGRG